MKKTIALLLALLLVAGALFAEVIDLADEVGGSTSYDMHLQAVVQEGGGLDNGDGEDPDDIKNGGLYIMVGYNYKNSASSNGYAMGSPYAPGDLEDLGTYHDGNPLTVSLVPEDASDNEGTLQFYVAAKSNSSVAKTTTVTFTSGGFKNVDNASAPTINIKFKGNGAQTSELEDNGLTAKHEAVASASQAATTSEEAATAEPDIKVTAEAGSKQMNYIYVARTDATWIKSSDYAAGTYNATITVTVATE